MWPRHRKRRPNRSEEGAFWRTPLGGTLARPLSRRLSVWRHHRGHRPQNAMGQRTLGSERQDGALQENRLSCAPQHGSHLPQQHMHHPQKTRRRSHPRLHRRRRIRLTPSLTQNMPLLTRAGAYFLHTQIPQDKGLGLTQIPLYRFFRLTQIPQISLIFFDGVKSHRVR